MGIACIGAWVGIVYNQFSDEADKDRADDPSMLQEWRFSGRRSYERFPIDSVFGPDWRSQHEALNSPQLISKIIRIFVWDPYTMVDFACRESISLLFNRIKRRRNKLDEGDINGWILDHGMAPNPLVRYLTSMMYLSNVTGLSKINYPNSEFMNALNFENLLKKHEIAIRFFTMRGILTSRSSRLFSNRPLKMDDRFISRALSTASTLCACSALPFIEETVKIDGDTLRRRFGRYGQLL